MHVLIIEDQWLIASLIKDQLGDLGYTTFDFAGSEAEAIDAARARCPDLITADVRLTDGNGVEAVRQICEDVVIPVVFITGDTAGIEVGLRGGVVLPKPFRMDELQQAVGDALVMAECLRNIGAMNIG
jgi:CheY-like chemotaxis protein